MKTTILYFLTFSLFISYRTWQNNALTRSAVLQAGVLYSKPAISPVKLRGDGNPAVTETPIAMTIMIKDDKIY
jgi:hypothetical protein